MFKKSLVLLVVLLLVVTTLAGCGQKPAQQSGSEQQQQPSQQPAAEAPKNILRMAIMSNPPKLDPVFATDTSSSRIIYQIFETLVDYDKDGNVQPLLAESWDISPDKKTYTFHLRKGVHFHKTIEGKPTANGGREVKADDWVWTFNYILSPETKSPRAYFLDMIKGYKDYQDGKTDHIAGISKVDDYTLKIEIDYPFAPFLSILAYNTFNVLPKEDVEKYGKEQFNFHPVGTGPFKFEQWVQDDKIVLSKNEDYWKKDKDGNQLPYLDGLEFRIVTDLAMEWTEFGLGNFDQIEEVDDPYYAEAKTKEGFQERAMLGTYYYGFNLTKAPFKGNKALRQAFNYAIDRKGLIDMVRNGRALPATGVLPPGMMGYDESIQPQYTFDPEKAKALMKEAGYPNGLKVELVYNTSEGHKRIAEALQSQFKNVGIDVSLKNIDWGALLDATDKLEIPFFRMGWVADYPDPDNFLYVLLHSSNIGPKGNYSGFNNKEFDDLTAQARVETDPAKRTELYKKAESIAREEAPWLFIYHYTTHSMVQPYVKNVELPFFGEFSMKYTEVKLEK
ncbi:MAG: peptide/nickel transport system substrate-binding protein [Thermoanaerobacteraceae bacterium]|jgi:peptide/nickel transport system substrate-binding protein/oligopeptide transport system substrate-binding protein|nr:peptide/nickel transport system substrate-binding protein [Thermoanaerobacteraceae bacterium]MDN5311943.1 peptide/nickel transport system substrate-binding protein [Thermoanaerobacteraceae bacterium]RKL63874.1 ABC transporter substrate-binding protein [Thermoanaerobacteraceae bacterium SP2]